MVRQASLALVAVAFACMSSAQDTKISDLTTGSPAQTGDMLPIARSGANYKLLGSDFCLTGNCTMTAPILGPSACTNPAYSFTDDTNAGVCLSAVNTIQLQSSASGNSRGYLTFGTSFSYVNHVGSGGNAGTVWVTGDGSGSGGFDFTGAAPSFQVTAAGVGTFGYNGTYDPLSITPVAKGANAFTGTFTSADLTAARTWTLPDADWTARCLSASTGISIANACGLAGNPSIGIDTATTPQYSQGTADPPATCTAGIDIYTETDTSEVSYCIATNTWLLLLGSATTATLTNKTLDQNGTGNSVTITKSTFRAGADVLADDSYDGVVLTGWNCGETIAQWDAVYLDDTANEWLIADADAAGKFPARGVVVAGCTDGNPGTVLVQGVIRNDGWNWAANGATLFLSDAGTGTPFTVTAPSTSGDCVQAVGFVLNDDQVYVNFSGHYLEVA